MIRKLMEKSSPSITMSIYACSVVLYSGTAPIAAHAGDSESIRAWIDKTKDDEQLTSCHIYGWHNLLKLEESEAKT